MLFSNTCLFSSLFCYSPSFLILSASMLFNKSASFSALVIACKEEKRRQKKKKNLQGMKTRRNNDSEKSPIINFFFSFFSLRTENFWFRYRLGHFSWRQQDKKRNGNKIEIKLFPKLFGSRTKKKLLHN